MAFPCRIIIILFHLPQALANRKKKNTVVVTAVTTSSSAISAAKWYNETIIKYRRFYILMLLWIFLIKLIFFTWCSFYNPSIISLIFRLFFSEWNHVCTPTSRTFCMMKETLLLSTSFVDMVIHPSWRWRYILSLSVSSSQYAAVLISLLKSVSNIMTTINSFMPLWTVLNRPEYNCR